LFERCLKIVKILSLSIHQYVQLAKVDMYV